MPTPLASVLTTEEKADPDPVLLKLVLLTGLSVCQMPLDELVARSTCLAMPS